MKTFSLLFAIFLITNISYSQIEIDDQSAEPKLVPVPYDGEFMSFDIGMKENIKAGVVGEYVTLLDVSTSNIYASQSDIDNYKSISYKLEDEFINKTYEVLGYKYKYNDILTIKNENNVYYWKVGYTDKYIFNKYLDKIKRKFEGKTFIPLHKTTEFEALDGTEIAINGEQKLAINKVKLAKLTSGYGIVFNINNTYDCIYPTDGYTQPRIFNGEIYATNDNYIVISSKNIFKSKVTLIEENEFSRFVKENNQFIEKIRERKVQVGMNEKQCRWAWGMPSSTQDNIAGYDKVLIYGDISNSQNLFFENDKLKLIK